MRGRASWGTLLAVYTAAILGFCALVYGCVPRATESRGTYFPTPRLSSATLIHNPALRKVML